MALSGIRWLEGATGLDITGQRKEEVETATVMGDNDDDGVLGSDQILTFLEKDLWKMQVGVGRDTIERVNGLKRDYVNGLNGTAFQNDRIVTLMEELEETRRAHEEVPTEDRRMKLVTLKMDISDRLTKRYMKMKDTRTAAEALRQVISEIQIANYDFANPGVRDQAQRGDRLEAAPEPVPEDHGAAAPVRDEVTTAGATLRKRRFVSDKEVKAVLRRKCKGE
eukprot:TRINITY_DN12668_c0_g1_i1.p1 TRINITY_DN12668_c0_g1~~TRINITY_DN12668_c0_g1_i1.p1  ORF type:complete len:223 (+),score=97.58 TRINITY_DN12668_c0_g1_i1:107-775(+)